jgi:hypothetical protein
MASPSEANGFETKTVKKDCDVEERQNSRQIEEGYFTCNQRRGSGANLIEL